jgi:DNA replication protein DnaC
MDDQEKQAIEKLLAYTESVLPLISFRSKRFDTWYWPGSKDGTVPKKYEALWKATAKFREDSEASLTLVGPPGVGKTHLALAIGWQMLWQNKQVIFYQVENLLDRIRSSFEGEKTEAILGSLSQCDLLILDDFGAHAVTEWGMAKLDAIVDYRYEHQAKLIVTANSLVMPERILDRLRDGLIIEVPGESQRGKHARAGLSE